MTLRHLKIFLAVCDNGYNVTKAAQALYIAQPAVSAAIRELEEYYGVKRFDRISRRFYITEAGKKFYQYARHVDSLFDQMEKEMRDWEALGVLRIGSSITVGSWLMPEYVKRFSEQYPQMQVQVKVEQSEQLEKKLLNNELDFACMEGVIHEPGLVGEEFLEDSLLPVIQAGAGIAPWEIITLEKFQRQHFLLREPGSGTREIFDSVVQTAGFSVRPVWESASNTALLNAACAGLGVTVLSSRVVAKMIAEGQLVPFQVEGLNFKRQFRIVYHQNKYLPAPALDFMELCRNTPAPPPPSPLAAFSKME